MFDKTQPADTTKLRNVGTVIRPNWDAIETADSSFKPYATNYPTRTDLAVPNDPAAIAGTAIVYCKDGPSGVTDLYVMNENGDIIQLTNGSVSPATPGHTILPGGAIMNWGSVVTNVSGPTATFSRAFTTGVYSITATAAKEGAQTVTVDNITLNNCRIYSLTVCTVYYVAIGK